MIGDLLCWEMNRGVAKDVAADLCQELDSSRKHGVDSACSREVVLCLQLSLTHSQAQQVAGGDVSLQQLLKEVVQSLQGA